MPQLGVRLRVAGHEHSGRGDPAEHLDRAFEPHVHGGVVAGAENHIGFPRPLDQPSGAVPIAVQVAEGQDPHRM